MQNLGYYNGKIGLLEEMTVPMNDRVCWFGDGVYDAGPCRNYHIFAMQEHIDRFFGNAQALDIEMPLSKEELAQLLCDLVRKLDTGDLFVYYQVTRGTALREHTYTKGPGNLWVMIKPLVMRDGSVPVSAITVEDTRFFHCNIKTLNLIPSVMASQKARQAGCEEAVFFRPGGRITEGSHSNVHILKNAELISAPADNLILPGIARAHLFKACRKLNIPVREEEYYLPDLFDADEILITSSSRLCMRVNQIDGKAVGCKDSKTYEALQQAVMEEFLQETKEM